MWAPTGVQKGLRSTGSRVFSSLWFFLFSFGVETGRRGNDSHGTRRRRRPRCLQNRRNGVSDRFQLSGWYFIYPGLQNAAREPPRRNHDGSFGRVLGPRGCGRAVFRSRGVFPLHGIPGYGMLLPLKTWHVVKDDVIARRMFKTPCGASSQKNNIGTT